MIDDRSGVNGLQFACVLIRVFVALGLGLSKTVIGFSGSLGKRDEARLAAPSRDWRGGKPGVIGM